MLVFEVVDRIRLCGWGKDVSRSNDHIHVYTHPSKGDPIVLPADPTDDLPLGEALATIAEACQ